MKTLKQWFFPFSKADFPVDFWLLMSLHALCLFILSALVVWMYFTHFWPVIIMFIFACFFYWWQRMDIISDVTLGGTTDKLNTELDESKLVMDEFKENLNGLKQTMDRLEDDLPNSPKEVP